jgi:hypothetical protein
LLASSFSSPKRRNGLALIVAGSAGRGHGGVEGDRRVALDWRENPNGEFGRAAMS